MSCFKAHAAVEVHWDFVFLRDVTSYRTDYFLPFGAISVKFLERMRQYKNCPCKKLALARAGTIIDSDNN